MLTSACGKEHEDAGTSHPRKVAERPSVEVLRSASAPELDATNRFGGITMRRATLAFPVVLLCALPVRGPAQGTAQQPPSWEQQVSRTWQAVHNKILAMAKDTLFPDAKLETRPHSDSRTILDEYRHVTIGLEMSTAQLKGEQFDYAARLKADESKPRTRASVVQEMEAAIASSYPAVESMASPRMLFWIDHQAEHYGKLVSNYRLAGVVPPVSRPRSQP
jgi:hypothetical protein